MKKGRTKVTAEIIRKVKRLHDSGMTSTEIMEYVGLSVSSIDSYVRIIDAAYGNGSFCMNPKVFNNDAVVDFCNDAGIPVPVNTFNAIRNGIEDVPSEKCEQMAIDSTVESQIYNALAKVSDGLHIIMGNLQMIANAIDSINSKENS